MQQLAWFIGEWQIHSRVKTDEDKWLEETARAVHTYELGGHLIFEHYFGPFRGEPFEAWSLRKYNPDINKWEQRWVDTSMGGFAQWTGTFADGTYIGYANRVMNDDGTLKDKAMREVFDNITPDRFSWRYEQTTDSGKTWTVTWTLEYTRVK
jgi:hypothetical protein